MSNFVKRLFKKEAQVAVTETFSPAGKMDTGHTWGTSLRDRDFEFAVRRDPVAYRLCRKIPMELFRRGFVVEEVTRKRGQPGDIDDAMTDTVMDLCDAYQILPRMGEAVGYEHQYGWAICPILNNFTVGEGGGTDEQLKVWLEPKGPTHILNETFYPSGKLQTVEIIRRPANEYKQLRIEAKDFVHLRTRPRQDLKFHEGFSLIEVLWDAMLQLRKVAWGAGQRIYRAGGLIHVMIAGADRTKLDAANAEFGNLGPRTTLFSDENTELKMPGLGGSAMDPLAYEHLFLSLVSIGTGVPVDILSGESDATLASGAITSHSYFTYLTEQQMLIIPSVLELLKKLNFTLPDDRALKFDLEFELDPKDQSLVKMNEITTLERRLPWALLNELREMDPKKLPPMADGDQLAIAQQAQLAPSGPTNGPGDGPFEGNQQPRTPAKDALPPITQDTYRQNCVIVINGYRKTDLSVKEAVKRFNQRSDILAPISERTYYNWKEKYG